MTSHCEERDDVYTIEKETKKEDFNEIEEMTRWKYRIFDRGISVDEKDVLKY